MYLRRQGSSGGTYRVQMYPPRYSSEKIHAQYSPLPTAPEARTTTPRRGGGQPARRLTDAQEPCSLLLHMRCRWVENRGNLGAAETSTPARR